MIAFMDVHRAAYRVEPICRVLPIAPSTYHAHVALRLDASKRSVRARRDAVLRPEVARVFAENFEAVEFATLTWVDWFNNRRLLEPIGNISPAEAEERYYAMFNEQQRAA